MNKLLCVLSILVVVVFACAKGKDNEGALHASKSTIGRDLSIAYSSYTQRGPYFSAINKAIEAITTSKGWSFVATDAENKAEKQMADVEDLLIKGIDYLILNPKDADAGVRIVRAAQKKEIPVITIDSDISPEAAVVTRVLSPNFASNAEIGRYVAEHFGATKISIGMIDGEKGNVVTTQRRNGFIQGLVNWQLDNRGGTNLAIRALLYTAWDAEGGVRGTEDLLSGFDDLNVIYVTTDDMARGAIRTLEASEKQNDIQVVGFDGSNEGIKLVRDGSYFATALNNPTLMVEQVFEVIEAYEGGQRAFPSVISYEPVIITQDTADAYVGKGF